MLSLHPPSEVILNGVLKNARCKAPEILRVASRRIRSDFLPRRELVSRQEAYLDVRCNDEGPAAGRGTPQVGIFQQSHSSQEAKQSSVESRDCSTFER